MPRLASALGGVHSPAEGSGARAHRGLAEDALPGPRQADGAAQIWAAQNEPLGSAIAPWQGHGYNCAACAPLQVELTGDNTPDARALMAADIIVVTPEKWDGISRSWQARSYVTKVALIVIDEIHLLGADRGPILEARARPHTCSRHRTESPLSVFCSLH